MVKETNHGHLTPPDMTTLSHYHWDNKLQNRSHDTHLNTHIITQITLFLHYFETPKEQTWLGEVAMRYFHGSDN